jgi:hypothetical protein
MSASRGECKRPLSARLTRSISSLITTLNVMFDKGFVKRKKAEESRGYEFSPKVTLQKCPWWRPFEKTNANSTIQPPKSL